MRGFLEFAIVSVATTLVCLRVLEYFGLWR